jgi:coenzyme F420-reducing hydrogenase gamma subunit
MVLRHEYTLPGDSGYEYDDEPGDQEQAPPDRCLVWRDRPCMGRGKCIAQGCYQRGHWPRQETNDDDPPF